MFNRTPINPTLALLACAWLIATVLGPANATENTWDQLAKAALERGDIAAARHLAAEALKDSSTSPTAHELLGFVEFREKNHEAAISHFQAASNGGLLGLEMMRDWSAALLALGRHPQARELLKQALDLYPSQVDLTYRLAGSYSEEGEWKQAWPYWEQVYRQGLRHAGVVLQLARARFAAGEDVQAVELLENWVSSTETADALWEAGKLLFEKTLYRQALLPLQKAWKQKPGSYEVGMYLSLAHYLLEQCKESGEILNRIATGPVSPLDYRVLRGSVRARLGQWDEARADLEAAIQHYPDRADGYLNLGLLLLERGEPGRAVEMFNRASRLPAKGAKLIYTIRSRRNCEGMKPPASQDTTDPVRSELCNQLAEQLYRHQQTGSALEVFWLALQLHSRSARAYAGIGRLCWERDSVAEAQTFLEIGLAFHPESADLHFNRGLVFQSLGDASSAVQSLEKAISLRGSDPKAGDWIQLGTARLASGRPNDAEAAFVNGLTLDPSLAQGHFELGKLYLQQSVYDRAEQALERATQLDPRLLGAYYQRGLVCLRTGKTERGKNLMQVFQRKKTLYEPGISSGASLGSSQP